MSAKLAKGADLPTRKICKTTAAILNPNFAGMKRRVPEPTLDQRVKALTGIARATAGVPDPDVLFRPQRPHLTD